MSFKPLALLMSRYGLIGGLSTAVHLGVASVAQSWLCLPTSQCHLAGFSLALMVSFLGHCFWTFQYQGHKGLALLRFLLVTGTAYSLSQVALSWMQNNTDLSSRLILLASVLLVPAVSFTLNGLWTFKPTAANQTSSS